MLTGSVPLSFAFLDDLFIGRGGLTPDTSITSPDLFLGLGGGGCLRGSVGLSDEDDVLAILAVGGGEAGLCQGDGGLGLPRVRDGDPILPDAFVRFRGTENERDLHTLFYDRIIFQNIKLESYLDLA